MNGDNKATFFANLILSKGQVRYSYLCIYLQSNMNKTLIHNFDFTIPVNSFSISVLGQRINLKNQNFVFSGRQSEQRVSLKFEGSQHKIKWVYFVCPLGFGTPISIWYKCPNGEYQLKLIFCFYKCYRKILPNINFLCQDGEEIRMLLQYWMIFWRLYELNLILYR